MIYLHAIDCFFYKTSWFDVENKPGISHQFFKQPENIKIWISSHFGPAWINHCRVHYNFLHMKVHFVKGSQCCQNLFSVKYFNKNVSKGTCIRTFKENGALSHLESCTLFTHVKKDVEILTLFWQFFKAIFVCNFIILSHN